MILFYFHPTPNPAKVALFLEKPNVPRRLIPVDTNKGEEHFPKFRRVNSDRKAPAIVDSDGPVGQDAIVFDPTVILLYLDEKTQRFLGRQRDRHVLLSWLMFVATGVGPFSGQAVHFQHAAPEKLPCVINRYQREVERHYGILDAQLGGKEFLTGDEYTIADMSAWGWLDRATRVWPGLDNPLDFYPNLDRWFRTVDARPAASRAREVGTDHVFKRELDDEARRALFPSNHPET
jgi:GST-like protein